MPLDTSYAAYLLRLRKMQDDSRATWVASVQSIPTGEQRSFPSVEALAAFLLAQFPGTLPDDDLGRQGRATSGPKGE
jgi:hypothetical protein